MKIDTTRFVREYTTLLVFVWACATPIRPVQGRADRSREESDLRRAKELQITDRFRRVFRARPPHVRNRDRVLCAQSFSKISKRLHTTIYLVATIPRLAIEDVRENVGRPTKRHYPKWTCAHD